MKNERVEYEKTKPLCPVCNGNLIGERDPVYTDNMYWRCLLCARGYVEGLIKYRKEEGE